MRVAYVLRSWPRLSQTFVLNEVLALERIGVPISIFAMTKADDPVVQPQAADVVAPVNYLDDPSFGGPGSHLRVATGSLRRYFSTLVFALTHRDLLGGYTRSSATGAFHRAVVIADRVGAQGHAGKFSHIHAHFAHDPALIGLLAHRLTGLPFSFTAHARDLYQIPRLALLGRAREACVVVTCCRSNADYLLEVVGQEGPPIELIYHGVDRSVFQPARNARRGAAPLIVSAGRLVEKKGFDDLLSACALLVAGKRSFRCEIYGEGPSRAELEAQRDRLGLADIVRFCGLRTQAELLPVYQNADVFALTPRVSVDGDRDGVPNVLFEAMACGVPVVATRVGGIAEVIADGTDGRLAPARDTAAIAACLEELLEDAAPRKRLGTAAARSAARFDSRASATRLAALFGYAGPSSP